MEPAAIVAKSLNKRFGDIQAVADLSLDIHPGEIFGLVGPDGAGKTTTLRMLSSIMDADSGSAAIAGFDVATRAAEVKDHLAYMSQRFSLYPDLTVSENIAFYADLYGVPKKGRQQRVDELLDFSSMKPFKKRRAGDLSGGMKQKLQLVCALIHTPRVLLLDEPTNGVDPVSRRDFWRILYQLLKKDVAILVTTAYLDEAERCNRVGLLNEGKLMATGTPDEIKTMMTGDIVAIKSPDAWKITKLIRDNLDCQSVNVFGDTVHVVCTNTDQAGERSRDLIESAGYTIESIHTARPSLEDVFVSVLSQKTTGDDEKQKHLMAEGLSSQSLQKDGEPAVRVSGLTRHFGDFTAVNAIGFEVPRGEIFGFLGPNGAGKSTTIRMLCGLLEPSDGGGTVGGFDIVRQPESIKQHIGYMSQKFSLYEDLTVSENIQFYGGIYGLANHRIGERRDWAIEMSGLARHRRSLTRTLSGGIKQRLALACALLHQPPIIFLDEPTSGVDPMSRRRFWDLIYAMADMGITVFVTTHYMEEAEYCDRVALIYGGNMIAMGAPVELKTRRMSDTILDLRCSRPQNVVQDIAALPQVRDAALFGAGLHIVVDNADQGTSAVREKLESMGIRIQSLEQVTPGMEDVFISLIEEVDRKNAENNDQ
ncbi:MAG: ATP-binding cassette domain-containing protein [Thermodesulfobacteriota bacterium]|nr:ATP-binding cassette domain-containing protein [Thermodesulfobacteriota bacterium]